VAVIFVVHKVRTHLRISLSPHLLHRISETLGSRTGIVSEAGRRAWKRPKRLTLCALGVAREVLGALCARTSFLPRIDLEFAPVCSRRPAVARPRAHAHYRKNSPAPKHPGVAGRAARTGVLGRARAVADGTLDLRAPGEMDTQPATRCVACLSVPKQRSPTRETSLDQHLLWRGRRQGCAGQ
jgi:hypothetical protein